MNSYKPILALPFLLAACVPKSDLVKLESDYGQVIEHKNKLQADLNEVAANLSNLRKTVSDLEAQVQSAKDAAAEQSNQRIDLQQQLRTRTDELEKLNQEFNHFKENRRAGMIDRKFPALVVKNLRMSDAVIKEVTPSSVKFVHTGGISIVRLADLGPEIQWEAVWTKIEADTHESTAKSTAERTAQNVNAIKTTDSILSAIKSRNETERRVLELSQLMPNLSALVEAKRTDLNNGFSKLSREFPRLSAASNEWDWEKPESSPLLVNWQKRPVMHGIKELDALAAAVRAAQTQGSAAHKELERLRNALANTQ